VAKAYISEYKEMARIQASKDAIAAVQEPAVVVQTPVAIGAEADSAAFGADTRFIRIHVDAICSIKFGTAPAATTDDARMAANTTEYFGVVPGQKVSIISNT